MKITTCYVVFMKFYMTHAEFVSTLRTIAARPEIKLEPFYQEQWFETLSMQDIAVRLGSRVFASKCKIDGTTEIVDALNALRDYLQMYYEGEMITFKGIDHPVLSTTR